VKVAACQVKRQRPVQELQGYLNAFRGSDYEQEMEDLHERWTAYSVDTLAIYEWSAIQYGVSIID